MLENYLNIFTQYFNTETIEAYLLPPSGSDRKNWILSVHGKKYVFTYNENLRENKSFLYFSELFLKRGVSVPKILWASDDGLAYLQSFAGEQTFYELMDAPENTSSEILDWAKKILSALYDFQIKNREGFLKDYAFDFPSFSREAVYQDMFYFKSFILDAGEISYPKHAWIQEVEKIAAFFESSTHKSMMLRDFQSRNVMLCNGQPVFIDYQSAMYGHVLYDAVSFIFQVKAKFSREEREKLMSYFIAHFPSEMQNELEAELPVVRFIRNTQVLGAYGFRGFYQKKIHFMESLHTGLLQLQSLINQYPQLKEEYPHICQSIYDISPEAFITSKK